jgi:Response regulator of the LytR/AlgR family
MLTCIMIGVLALARLVFYFLYKYVPFKWWNYLLWCSGEVFVISCFHALYTSLFEIRSGGMPYFTALALCQKVVVLTLLYPYLISILSRIIINKNADIKEAFRVPEESLLKLYDEHKRLKLTIDPSAIVYVSAEANYINIHFVENDRVKSFILRNSMKSFEEAACNHGIVRCHRSFFANPKHVKVLSRDTEGVISIEFNEAGVSRIPVSKVYYDNLARLL